MKKVKLTILIIVFVILITIGVFTAINVRVNDNVDEIKIVCTAYPIYDFAKEITKDVEEVEVYLLTENGIDMHNYEPTVADISNIKTSDLFIYIGGESDGWVNDVITEDMNTLRMIEKVGTLIYANHDHEEEEHVHDESCNHEYSEFDEHIWMSIDNAKQMVGAILSQIEIVDSENAETYASNAVGYMEELESLKVEYEKIINMDKNTLIVGGRNPFNYLASENEIEISAAYDGCQAEFEVSFETVVVLSQEVDKKNVTKIVVEENANLDIANAIIANSNAIEVLELNSMQSIDLKDEYVSYLEIARTNLDILIKVLT